MNDWWLEEKVQSNMMKSKIALFSIGVCLVLTLLASFKHVIYGSYATRISQADIFEVFENGSDFAFRDLLSKKGFVFAKFENGFVTYRSSKDIPNISLITVRKKYQGNVLIPKAQDRIKSLVPKVSFVNWRPYFVVTMVQNSDESGGYIVFVPVFAT